VAILRVHLTFLLCFFSIFSRTACEGEPAGENEKCVLVESTVTVAAPQTLEPSESLLRNRVVTILRDAIKSGKFAEPFKRGECSA